MGFSLALSAVQTGKANQAASITSPEFPDFHSSDGSRKPYFIVRHMSDIQGRLAFIQEAERLKCVLRSAHTSTGRQESTAEHSWRLCLLAMSFQDLLQPIDFERVLKLCVIHDLGEAIGGDVPAVIQTADSSKRERERADLLTLTRSLSTEHQTELLALWEEYEFGASREARLVKALDKIETLIQHNQGRNPGDFDYSFNLSYGAQYANEHPVIAQLRALVDADTRSRLREAGAAGAP